MAASSVAPSDTILGPLQQQLSLVAQQIQGIDPNLCYTTPPKSSIEDGAVLFPCKGWGVDSMTNGRLRLKFTFHILHMFRMRPIDEVIPDIQTWVPAWLTVLSDWNNQTLGGHAISFDFTSGEITQVRFNNTDYFALKHVVTVLTQFSVITQPH